MLNLKQAQTAKNLFSLLVDLGDQLNGISAGYYNGTFQVSVSFKKRDSSQDHFLFVIHDSGEISTN